MRAAPTSTQTSNSIPDAPRAGEVLGREGKERHFAGRAVCGPALTRGRADGRKRSGLTGPTPVSSAAGVAENEPLVPHCPRRGSADGHEPSGPIGTTTAASATDGAEKEPVVPDYANYPEFADTAHGPTSRDARCLPARPGTPGGRTERRDGTGWTGQGQRHARERAAVVSPRHVHAVDRTDSRFQQRSACHFFSYPCGNTSASWYDELKWRASPGEGRTCQSAIRQAPDGRHGRDSARPRPRGSLLCTAIPPEIACLRCRLSRV